MLHDRVGYAHGRFPIVKRVRNRDTARAGGHASYPMLGIISDIRFLYIVQISKTFSATIRLQNWDGRASTHRNGLHGWAEIKAMIDDENWKWNSCATELASARWDPG